MLKPARAYADKLNKLKAESQYDEKFKFLSANANSNAYEEMSENTYHEPFWHQYVSVYNDEVLGYIGYSIEYSVRSAFNFNTYNFGQPNIIFTKDVIQAVKEIFHKFGCNRLEFTCTDGNPALEQYKRFIKKYGGTECGCFHDSVVTWDGVIRDLHYFEIMKRDFKL